VNKAKRPTISLSAATHEKLKAYCELHGISMAQFVETRVDEFLNAQPENLLDAPAEVVADRPVASEMYDIARRLP